MEDLGNKPRRGYQSDPSSLSADPRTKLLLWHQPYSQDFFRAKIGTHVNTNSTANAVLGMYLGLAQLCHLFEMLPDRTEYTHILRMRTDCAVMCPDFTGLLSPGQDVVTISHEPGMHEGWCSDHILFASRETFLRIFALNDIKELYAIFDRAARNPEKMLYYLIHTRSGLPLKKVEAIERFRDYQIVYSPPRTTDQPWLRAMIEEGLLPELFWEPEKYRRVDEDAALLAEREAAAQPRDPYSNPVRNFLRYLKQRARRRG